LTAGALETRTRNFKFCSRGKGESLLEITESRGIGKKLACAQKGGERRVHRKWLSKDESSCRGEKKKTRTVPGPKQESMRKGKEMCNFKAVEQKNVKTKAPELTPSPGEKEETPSPSPGKKEAGSAENRKEMRAS